MDRKTVAAIVLAILLVIGLIGAICAVLWQNAHQAAIELVDQMCEEGVESACP